MIFICPHDTYKKNMEKKKLYFTESSSGENYVAMNIMMPTNKGLPR
jgi:hypothetical protein